MKGRGYRLSDLGGAQLWHGQRVCVGGRLCVVMSGTSGEEPLSALFAPVASGSCGFLLWLSRLWLLASRGELHEDPVVYAITDKRSLLLGLIVVAIVLSAL